LAAAGTARDAGLAGLASSEAPPVELGLASDELFRLLDRGAAEDTPGTRGQLSSGLLGLRPADEAPSTLSSQQLLATTSEALPTLSSQQLLAKLSERPPVPFEPPDGAATDFGAFTPLTDARGGFMSLEPTTSGGARAKQEV
jgi:hypothetical protein